MRNGTATADQAAAAAAASCLQECSRLHALLLGSCRYENIHASKWPSVKRSQGWYTSAAAAAVSTWQRPEHAAFQGELVFLYCLMINAKRMHHSAHVYVNFWSTHKQHASAQLACHLASRAATASTSAMALGSIPARVGGH
jgi:hypothetical protein